MAEKPDEQNSNQCPKNSHPAPSSPKCKEGDADAGMQCPDCKGAGSVLLLTSRRPCQKCHGTGKLRGLNGTEETVQATDAKPEGESSRQTLIVITRTEFTEDEDGNIVDVKEISREEKLVPVSDADGQVDWPPDSIMHESWPGGEIAYYEYDSTEENGTLSNTSHDVATDAPTTASSAICPECKGNCFFTALGSTKRCKRCRGTGFCDIEP